MSDLVSAAIGLALILATVLIARRTTKAAGRAARHLTRGRRPEDVLTLVAAVIATAVQATGMWRFFGTTLHFSGPLRVLLFAFLEVAVFTSALRARRNVAESFTHSPGIDGIAVWTLTGLSAVLSAMDARSFAEVLFRLAAPLVAAWLWERGMSVERRRITGRSRINWRITPERILVRLGVAEASDRTASDVDAHRRLHRVAQAAKQLRARRDGNAADWRQTRAERRLDTMMARAVEHASLATDPDRQAALMAQLGALYGAAELAEVRLRVPWALPSGRPKLRLVRREELEPTQTHQTRNTSSEAASIEYPNAVEPDPWERIWEHRERLVPEGITPELFAKAYGLARAYFEQFKRHIIIKDMRTGLGVRNTAASTLARLFQYAYENGPEHAVPSAYQPDASRAVGEATGTAFESAGPAVPADMLSGAFVVPSRNGQGAP